MHPVHAELVSFFTEEVQWDGGLDLLSIIGPVAQRMMAANIAEHSEALAEAGRSADGRSGGFFSRTVQDLEEDLADLLRQSARLDAILEDPHRGDFQSPLARWLAECFGGENPAAAPWRSRYEDHLTPGAQVVPTADKVGERRKAIETAERNFRHQHGEIVQVPVASCLSIAILPSLRGASATLAFRDGEGRVISVTSSHIARVTREDAQCLGFGSALCALDMVLLPSGNSQRRGYMYTEAGMASRLAAVDILHAIGAAMGEEPGDPGPRPFVANNMIRFAEPECEPEFSGM